ncbi:hypothetical protein ACLMJK_006883 [Lecanora helva]
MERGACTPPFLQLSKFDSTVGYLPGRFCAPVPTLEGTVNCCLPCPITDWVYSDEFDVIPKAANWLNVAGMVCSVSMLATFFVLPISRTNRHYLTVGLVIALGFIIPLAANPDQCHDSITPNDMYSDMTCAFSGAFLLFGGFAAIFWGFLRSLSIHLQICWQVVPGKKFFWASILGGWGVPALIVAIALPVTGISYRFGDTCHINHTKALDDYWGPLLAFAAISTVLQFTTFGYCIKVYIKSLFEDSNKSSSQASSGGLPSYTSRSGSIKTVTARQAYRRVQKVIALQWRGTVIVLIIIINVVFLAVVFVQMDNTVTAAVHHLEKAEPWLLCLVMNQGNKNACLDKVRSADLVTSEATVMAVLILLSLNGIWTLLFLGRTSMLVGWLEIIRSPFQKRPTEFASVDARRFSNNPKSYEMITSPPPRTADSSILKSPEAVITSPPLATKTETQIDAAEAGISPFLDHRPPSSHYSTANTNSVADYFSTKDFAVDFSSPPPSRRDSEHHYRSPKLSFSTPRPPSSTGGPLSSHRGDSFSSRMMETQSPPQRSGRYRSPSGGGEGYEWDPARTYAKGMGYQ